MRHSYGGFKFPTVSRGRTKGDVEGGGDLTDRSPVSEERYRSFQFETVLALSRSMRTNKRYLTLRALNCSAKITMKVAAQMAPDAPRKVIRLLHYSNKAKAVQGCLPHGFLSVVVILSCDSHHIRLHYIGAAA